MNYRSALQHLGLLIRGDRQAWRYIPYQLKMKARGIDLRWTSLQESGLSEERCYRYSDSGGPDLESLLDTLPILPSDEVLDIGCGKGGALISFAKYPFSRVDGVEISASLAQVARENIQKLKLTHATVHCCDASDFTSLDSYTYFYMYNPFPHHVMASVLQNIRSSLRRRMRRLTLIYKNAVFHELLVDTGFSKITETLQIHPDYPPFAVYAAGGPVHTGSLASHLSS
jgi:SAM-dependent methyltransferase